MFSLFWSLTWDGFEVLLSKLEKTGRELLSQLLEEKNQSQRAGAVLQHILCMVCYVSPVLGLECLV